MEWRLVYNKNRNRIHFTGDENKGFLRVKFDASDVKVIIFPDERIKQIALQNKTIRDFFSNHMPIMATLDDCHSF